MYQRCGMTIRKVLGVLFVAAGLLAVIYLVVGKRHDRPSPASHAPVSAVIHAAQVRGKEADSVERKGREFGLNCMFEHALCADLIGRAEKNTKLASAFHNAKAAGVGLHPQADCRGSASVGEINDGFIIINVCFTDQKLIEFLTK